MSVSWYVNRLRTMSAREVGFRAGQYLQKRREKKTQTGLFPQVALKRLPACVLPIGEIPFTTDKSVVSIFGLDFDYSQPIDWHADISSGRRFPMAFAKDINIRTEEYGSAKHVWEVNRMQFLTLVALQYRDSADPAVLQQFQQIITSWIEQNPYLEGVNWYSNIEVNIRLIVWFFCWEILDVNRLVAEDEAFKNFTEQQWIPLIHRHLVYSHENPSRFSSANNHLVSEYAGLFIGAAFWPFEESEAWRHYAQQGLEREIQTQHSANGVNLEEAAEYIQFITDFFLFAYVVGQRTGHHFSQDYRQWLENILEYIFHLMDVKGNIPYYGDEDDGKVCIFDADPHFPNFKSLLTSGVVLFENPAWKTKANGFDTKNQVLFGRQGRQTYEAVSAFSANQSSCFYSKEGHFFIRKQHDSQEIYLHIDAAPLGFLSIAAHGHADALSFVLHVDGQPVITEAGTYTYHTERAWRDYFISTLAHNTLRVDRTDQAKSTGPTMWMNHYEPKVLHQKTQPDQDVVWATHNGYDKLGVSHQREIVFDKLQDKIVITDQVLMKNKKQHFLELPFHLHPEVLVEPVNAHHFLLKTKGTRTVSIKMDPKMHYELIRGQEDPILGWYSPSFQIKMPAPVLYGSMSADHSVTFVTEIKVQHKKPAS